MRHLITAAVIVLGLTFGALADDGKSTTEIYPLLPMIFFGLDSSELPSRYVAYPFPAHAKGFVEDTITSTLNAYYNYLNIIGKRMQAYPATSIEIVGCRDTIGEKSEALSLARAKTISRYLQDIWQIAPDRLKISARGLPQTPSNLKMEEGREENRRVEILSKDWEIIKPVVAKIYPQIQRAPVERHEILRFKFNSYDMGEDNRTYFKEFVLPSLERATSVKVYGYENLLDPEETMGFRRAREIAKLIKSSAKRQLMVETVHPQVRYNNMIPEGRFYHRSVLIEILQ
jgi:hypothetical protein